MGSLRGLRPEMTGIALGSILPVSRARVSIVPVAVLVVVCLAGCRSGSSMKAPSWSMFGGSTKTSEKLAAAPPFEGDVAKPSASAKPYPTTSNPEGYVLESTRGAGADAVDSAAPPTTPADVAPVVYGTTPPPSAAAPDAYARATPPVAGPPPGAGTDPPMSSIVPQVGPYAASTPAEPAAPAGFERPTPDAVAAPPAAYASGAPTQLDAPPSPPARMADARASSTYTADRAATDAGAPYAGQSRYAV
ncbi:MAG: hypothetical protein ACKOES_01800 [Planctomycetaceae bacterium]